MIDRTRPDVNWEIAFPNGEVPTWERVSIAVLMDIRRELKRLNAAIYCDNFLGIPQDLRQIRRNTAKPRKKKPAKKVSR